LMFRGREVAFKDKGRALLQRFVVDSADHGQLERDVYMEGRIMPVVIAPKSDKKPQTNASADPA